MKKLMLTLVGIIFAYSSTSALSFEESRNRAWYLTDKMAYELNLTPEQYDKAYEINLNYFLNINYASDIDGQYWRYRNQDLSYILFDWQFNRYVDISYFYRPLIWRSGVCIMTTYDFYDRGFFYFSRPAIFNVYRGISWRERPRHNPYRNMTFSANGGMRDRYGERGHGYYFRNGERFDAPKYNGEHYGRRDDRHNPGPDFDKGMNYNRNGNYNNGRDFGRNDNKAEAGNSNRNNGKVYGGGSNYRDKNENSGNAGYKFDNNNRNNGNNSSKDHIQTPDNNNSNGSSNGLKYVSTDNNRSNLNGNNNFGTVNRNNNNISSGNSNRNYTPGGRTGTTRNNINVSGNNNRSFSQRVQSSSNASRNIQGSSPATRNTSPAVQSAPSNRSNTNSTGNNNIRTRSFGKR